MNLAQKLIQNNFISRNIYLLSFDRMLHVLTCPSVNMPVVIAAVAYLYLEDLLNICSFVEAFR